MIKISSFRTEVDKTPDDIKNILEGILSLKADSFDVTILRQSFDCRVRHPLSAVYTLALSFDKQDKEKRAVKRLGKYHPVIYNPVVYNPVIAVKKNSIAHPVVTGTGPAGLLCALVLSENGFCPLIVERGSRVEERKQKVDCFWHEGQLDTECNVSFGEGGAGAFSDGKLNTSVKDRSGRQDYILDTFISAGAPEDIRYSSHPHIGTDRLRPMLSNLRKRIESLGGRFLFDTRLDDIITKDGKVQAVVLSDGTERPCDALFLGIGHSARDTFRMLERRNVPMRQKNFAVGVRIEHSREMINSIQYKEHADNTCLPTASYKMTYHAPDGRAVYTFCMCPGGYVVNASTEKDGIVVNGMSNYDRMADNSNSAIVVSVGPDDFPGSNVLSGMEFQRELERKAWACGQGAVPVCRYEDFKLRRPSKDYGRIKPVNMGSCRLSGVWECLPGFVTSDIINAVDHWALKMKGYDDGDALICAVESRTSCPVQIIRNDNMQSDLTGLFPMGEGAGYAGGIMSAALDGMKAAEAAIKGEVPCV